MSIFDGVEEVPIGGVFGLSDFGFGQEEGEEGEESEEGEGGPMGPRRPPLPGRGKRRGKRGPRRGKRRGPPQGMREYGVAPPPPGRKPPPPKRGPPPPGRKPIPVRAGPAAPIPPRLLALDKRPVVDLHRMVRAHHDKLRAEGQRAESVADRASDAREVAQKSGRKAEVAKGDKARRLHGARDVALFLRRHRTLVAVALAEEAKEAKLPKRQEVLRRAAIVALAVPVKLSQGVMTVGCVATKFSGLDAYGEFGYLPGAAYDQGATVPQTGSGTLPETTAGMMRRAIQAGSNVARPMSMRPAAVQVPSFVQLPGVAPLQVRPPAFHPVPPRTFNVSVPAVPPRQQRPVVIPAARQHPEHRQPRLVRVASPPPPIPRIPHASALMPVGPGQVMVRHAGPPVTQPPRQGFVTMGPPPGQPSMADMGWLGEDPIAADVAGAFEDVVLGAEAEADEAEADVDFGPEDLGATTRPGGRRTSKASAGAFKIRLGAHKHRAARQLVAAIVAVALDAAKVGPPPPGLVKKIVKEMAESEGKLAAKAKLKVTAAQMKGSQKKLAALILAAKNPCGAGSGRRGKR